MDSENMPRGFGPESIKAVPVGDMERMRTLNELAKSCLALAYEIDAKADINMNALLGTQKNEMVSGRPDTSLESVLLDLESVLRDTQDKLTVTNNRILGVND